MSVYVYDSRKNFTFHQLKPQAQGQLHLALAIESRAVGVGDGSKLSSAIGSTEVGEASITAWGSGAVDDVACRVNAGRVLVVEDVEDLTDDFKVIALADMSVLGETSIDVIDTRVAKSI